MIAFAERLRAAQQHTQSMLAVGLAPFLETMPYPMQRHDDPLLPFGKAIINATRDLCCAYVFDLAAYLAIGASGAIALERTIAYVPAPLLKILHGPFTRAEYARAASESAFVVDAVTLTAVPSLELIPFLQDGRGVFVDASNPPLIRMDDMGSYKVEEDHIAFDLPGVPSIRCYTEAISSASRADDFAEAAHSAAERLRNLK